ncbi:hypothetical protein QQX13_00255 [Demequina sp. SYSU T00068]|uniref:methyltransferase domain-containing protein n=1 Tax=Demequina lignilytica TaxID=3051663 RepID=UPI0026198FF7|nr:methyltransferase domain-containing protein [Demequina sp. SYSU T00068]MDN4489255.1 hypothetical protein [Demequina sp. SYSU T00068]
MITRDDYDWWLATASQVDWTWAKTYADTAPHHYVVEGRTTGIHHDDFVRAARVIHTFGQPGKYYGTTNIYLENPEARLKWWTMDANVTDTNLINRTTTDRLYGVQNAPATYSGIESQYDSIATTYDIDRPMAEEVVEMLHEAVRGAAGRYPPSVLDVACGTGRALDLGLALSDRYAGVDPSTPMLNQLVRKHPKVARLYPTTIEHALTERLFTPRQFEIVTLMVDESDKFSSETLTAVSRLASRAFVHVRGDQVTVHRCERASADTPA